MKKTISLLLALLLCIGLTSPAHASAAPFADVPSSHWAYKEILKAYKDGAVNGTSPSSYKPNGNVTMAQFIAILTRAFYPNAVTGYKGQPSDPWYAPYYAVAEFDGFFQNIPDRLPDTEVTRQVMAQILYNFLMAQQTDGGYAVEMPDEQERAAVKNKIPDFSAIDGEMREAAASCYALGLITGMDNTGRFAPDGKITRAQTAAIYVRLKRSMWEFSEEMADFDREFESGTGTDSSTDAAALTNGKPVTVDNVLDLIDDYRNGNRLPGAKAQAAGFRSYMDLSYYDAYNPPYNLKCLGRSGTECAKFAFAFWDDLFGDLPARKVTDVNNVRPGDLIQSETHWSIAIVRSYVYEQGTKWESICTDTVDGGPTGEIAYSTIPQPVDGNNVVAIYTRYPD